MSLHRPNPMLAYVERYAAAAMLNTAVAANRAAKWVG